MKWTEDYATGIPGIDEQHKMIFTMAEDYRTALDAGEGEQTYGLLLDFLDRYIRVHFGFEERCMEEYQCPAAQKNHEAHKGFIELLADFRERYAANRYRASDARELVDSLERWFSGHILRIDTDLRQYASR